MSVRVGIVEDDAPYRSAVADLLAVEPGFEVTGTYASATAALAAAQAGAPWDLVLMDIELPELDGIEATRQLKGLSPATAIVMLTAFEDPARIVGAICAGADGYLLKQANATELLDEIRSVAAGGSPLTPSVARSILALMRAGSPAAPTTREAAERWGLSGRELDVLRLLVQGHSYKQVGGDLCISLDTVRSHVRNIYRKLRVHSVAEAVGRALREGIV